MIDRNGSSSNMWRDRKPRGIQTHKADDADWVKKSRFARSEYHSSRPFRKKQYYSLNFLYSFIFSNSSFSFLCRFVMVCTDVLDCPCQSLLVKIYQSGSNVKFTFILFSVQAVNVFWCTYSWMVNVRSTKDIEYDWIIVLECHQILLPGTDHR